MPKQDKGGTWLEQVLQQGLQRVSPPDELWDRVVLPRVEARPAAPRFGFVWMLAAGGALAASVIAVTWGYPLTQSRSFTQRQPMEFSSNRASDIRGWVREHTGIDIPLQTAPGSALGIVRATITAQGNIELHYQTEDGPAFLNVSAVGGELTDHSRMDVDSLRYARTVSWSMDRHSYKLTVERAAAMGEACRVCHAVSAL